MTTFTPPATSSDWAARDAIGHLCIFEPVAYETGIPTPYKNDADAVRCIVHDVDAGTTSEDALIFQGGLIGALKNRVGQTVLATVTQGVAKPGQSAPWTLTDATGDPAAVKRATDFLDAYKSGGLAAPEPAVDAATAAALKLLKDQGLA